MKNSFHKKSLFTAISGVLLTGWTTLQAGQVGPLTEFAPETPALASEVNGNFSELAVQVNDNDLRVIDLEANADAQAAQLSSHDLRLNEVENALGAAPLSYTIANISGKYRVSMLETRKGHASVTGVDPTTGTSWARYYDFETTYREIVELILDGEESLNYPNEGTCTHRRISGNERSYSYVNGGDREITSLDEGSGLQEPCIYKITESGELTLTPFDLDTGVPDRDASVTGFLSMDFSTGTINQLGEWIEGPVEAKYDVVDINWTSFLMGAMVKVGN